jgi:hypothetical protein
MLAIAARFEIANDDWFYDPAVSGADPIEDATRLQRCISLTGDYLWERAAIAVDGFPAPQYCEKSPQAGRVIGRS